MPEMAGSGEFAGYLTGRTRMPTPQREPLRALSPAEQGALQRIAKSSSERVDQVRRGSIPPAGGGGGLGAARPQPTRRSDGTATWSLTTMQRSLRRSGLPQVGTSTIRRVLQDAGSSYQRTRTWCPTGTALRKRKTGPVQVVDPETEEKRDLIDHAYRLAEQ